MYLIAGLGNPEKKYIGTRHNAGFAVIDVLLDRLGDLKLNDTKFNGAYTKARIGDEQVLLVKPLTYMNLSGDCIAPLAAFYKIPVEHVIVCYDDIDLEVGRIRVRGKGSAGGHNGIKSLIARLGSQDFPRVKVGVGAKPDKMDLAAHVLSKFSQTDEKRMEEAYSEAADAVVTMIEEGLERAMNIHNAKK